MASSYVTQMPAFGGQQKGIFGSYGERQISNDESYGRMVLEQVERGLRGDLEQNATGLLRKTEAHAIARKQEARWRKQVSVFAVEEQIERDYLLGKERTRRTFKYLFVKESAARYDIQCEEQWKHRHDICVAGTSLNNFAGKCLHLMRSIYMKEISGRQAINDTEKRDLHEVMLEHVASSVKIEADFQIRCASKIPVKKEAVPVGLTPTPPVQLPSFMADAGLDSSCSDVPPRREYINARFRTATPLLTQHTPPAGFRPTLPSRPKTATVKPTPRHQVVAVFLNHSYSSLVGNKESRGRDAIVLQEVEERSDLHLSHGTTELQILSNTKPSIPFYKAGEEDCDKKHMTQRKLTAKEYVTAMRQSLADMLRTGGDTKLSATGAQEFIDLKEKRSNNNETMDADTAAARIQRNWRRHLAVEHRNTLQHNLRTMLHQDNVTAALKIITQGVLIYNARRELRERARKVLESIVSEQRCEAASRIQGFTRMVKAKQTKQDRQLRISKHVKNLMEGTEEKEPRFARFASTIQLAYRQHAARNALKTRQTAVLNHLKREIAAYSLQRTLGTFAARKEARKRRSAIKQYIGKMNKGAPDKKDIAATRIQTIARGYLARRLLRAKRREMTKYFIAEEIPCTEAARKELENIGNKVPDMLFETLSSRPSCSVCQDNWFCLSVLQAAVQMSVNEGTLKSKHSGAGLLLAVDVNSLKETGELDKEKD